MNFYSNYTAINNQSIAQQLRVSDYSKRKQQARRKQLNASTTLKVDFAAVAVVIFAITAGVSMALYHGDQGAHSGQILAKSEMSKQQLASMNVMPVKSEKRHALR